MFHYVFFRRLLLAMLAIVAACSLSIYLFSVPLIKKTVYTIEKDSAQTILENVYQLLQSEARAIDAYREHALFAYKRQLKNITQIQESLLVYKYNQFRDGKISEAQARREALEEMRHLRYGNNDYVWVADYKSVLISHPDPELDGADFSQVKDIYGNLIVPPMVAVARKNFEGYTSYWWRRLGEEAPIEKLTYSRHFPQWEWVIGTGVYIDDVEAEVARRKEAMIEEMRQVLRQIKIARTGYMYVFDGQMNMIMHPNSNIEHTNFADLRNPVTGNAIGQELMAVAREPDNRLYYKWDRPDDKGRYVYDKISWVKYIPNFDWYIASSVYLEELNSGATLLRNRILSVSAVMFVLSLVLVLFLVRRMLVPLQKLSDMALKVKGGDLDARCEVAGKDEIAMLAGTFNGMVTELKGNITQLDDKVHARTLELDQKNRELEQQIFERERMGQELTKANEKLTVWVTELEQHNREIALLNQMGDMLQACHAVGETFVVITETVEGLFPGESGALFMLSDTSSLLERVARWGRYPESQDLFPPEDCWGLRRGKVHRVERPGSGQACPHIKMHPPYGSVCVPLVGQGEVLGLLHLRFGGPDPQLSEEENARRAESRERLAMTVSDHLALALANLKLRDRLQDLSVRDPLTRLFNRRYLEETLTRELRRAERAESNLGVIMLDVDHFKHFNDTHGHEMGDRVLKAIGALLMRGTRAQDVPCRFGGEEFVLILPGASLEDSCRKADELRRQLRETAFDRNLDLDTAVTISAGVAAYPQSGKQADHILEAADKALYHAKAQGRDRVVAAGAADRTDTDSHQ